MLQVIDSPANPASIDAFNGEQCIETVSLPLSVIGQGNSDLSAKFEAAFASIKLDVAQLLG